MTPGARQNDLHVERMEEAKRKLALLEDLLTECREAAAKR